MTTKHETREAWLIAAIHRLGRLFPEGTTVPEVWVSIGFPGGGSAKTRIGECWNGVASSDGQGHIFVSPIVNGATEILAVLAHEIIHAINHANDESGHGKCFSALAKPLGLTGKMTATVAGPELVEKLQAIAEELGDFPSGNLSLTVTKKKQTTRMIKLECDCCGYTVRTTQKWIDEGLPSCPRGTMMVTSES